MIWPEKRSDEIHLSDKIWLPRPFSEVEEMNPPFLPPSLHSLSQCKSLLLRNHIHHISRTFRATLPLPQGINPGQPLYYRNERRRPSAVHNYSHSTPHSFFTVKCYSYCTEEKWKLFRDPAFDNQNKWLIRYPLQSCAEKRNCFAKQQPGVAGCGWLQLGRNFLST